ncbi:FAD-dependent 2-octaprenylphenol hydroxylase [Budviciaceae bacterium BWR-B9]|uniref:FAD-dependent 2-octaprenylphenol hydroxylase n=1 Tax=Limnobaculum allomyrinae TaxID=2791986 RepID=A0ABS1IRR1_9GAMM|nr:MULTISPECIES: FAD-dependent 2-octaprenylphenol hydroxylase [Limnobaculum]MBK5144448.1 FAD-dependent 2-octaprenylphenol hydroxylase [Limnobaculum allomyrinae]MBV7692325.1 FAD-dependent 2-octaprenylphenol hydroxylase [Limnobaculum sp. M2-1]
MHSYDVVIAGGGMVGLSLACGLQGSGLRIAIVENQLPDESLSTEPSLRVSAINAASERFLDYLGVWKGIEALRLSPYSAMDVWDRDSFGRIAFKAEDYGYTHLGHIIENDVIHKALWDKANSSGDITLLAPARLKQVVRGENEAFITLEDGRMLSGRLVVGADGANSWVRQHADIPLTFRDYGHHALVATIRTDEPHQHCARQVFHGDGILAFLPLWQSDLCSIVWSLPPEKAEQMKQMDEQHFNHQLGIAFDNRLGRCHVVSDRAIFPLTARYARSFAAHRLALVGDAAHTIHPLAGQGVNLGFMDAACLTEEIRRLQKQGKDLGNYLYLRKYERSRKQSAAMMLAAMQGFRDVFDGDNPAKKLFRDIGLKLADTLPGVKPHLVHQAMGLRDLPDWLASPL